MLLYDGLAAHTLTVRQFIHERGHLKLDVHPVDMPNLEHRRLKYRTTVNKRGEVPALQLDDGSVLTETLAICLYLDEVATGGTSLFGSNPQERAITQMWLRRIDLEIVQPLMRWFRDGPESVNYYRGNRIPHPEAQLTEKILVNQGLNLMDDEMDDGRQFICGERFSMADVYLYSMMLSMGQAAPWLNPPGRTNIYAWMERVGARKPSSEAVNVFGTRVEV